MNNNITYKDAGVNIKDGDDYSSFIYTLIRNTWRNEGWRKIIVPFDDFSGLRMIDVSNLGPEAMMGLNFDGIGTKVEIAERCGRFDTLGYDLMAMVCDDAAIRGAEPVLVGSILDFNRLNFLKNKDHLVQIVEGYVKAALAANVSIINGEVAELGNRVGGFGNMNFNWGAGCVWFGRKSNLISCKDIKVGHKLVAFREDGFRSNGLSLVRRILENHFSEGSKIDNLYYPILEPSQIYTKVIVDITGGFSNSARIKVSGMAHITGGGLPGKVGRMLKPTGLGAKIDRPMEPSQIMLDIQELGCVSDTEAYSTWNMGQGLVIATSDSDTILRVASEYRIQAQVIGEVIQKPVIEIKNRGCYSGINWLQFSLGGK